ncbi:MAG TPA: hypothetical protein VE282_03370 [Gemmatimonadales bacterium]|nr:hypothetical protein [Gemmatimonadales bacterium]
MNHPISTGRQLGLRVVGGMDRDLHQSGGITQLQGDTLVNDVSKPSSADQPGDSQPLPEHDRLYLTRGKGQGASLGARRLETRPEYDRRFELGLQQRRRSEDPDTRGRNSGDLAYVTIR